MAKQPAPAPQRVDPIAMNAMQSQAVRQYALNQTLSQQFSYTPPTQGGMGGPGSILNFPLRNVGLNKRLTIVISGNITVGAAETQTLTPFGPANFFSNILLTDLSNQYRVNTSGWHLHYLTAARQQAAPFGAYSNDSPTSIGNNYNVIKAPASYTTSQPFFMVYEVPLAYSDNDLRGAIWANVQGATWNLQLTVNPNLFLPSTGNPVQGMYRSSTAQLGVLSNWKVEIFQHFLDNLPRDNTNTIILPVLDLATMYRLENNASGGLVANAENGYAYTNFRTFLSTFALYDNAGVQNAGTDVTNFAIQTANTTNFFRYTPQMIAAQTRKLIGDDMPPGMYYFSHRDTPIETSEYGNMQLLFTPSAVTSSASNLLLGYEYFANQNIIAGASSIAN